MKKIGSKITSILLIAACLINSTPIGVLADMISENKNDAVSSVTVGNYDNEGDIQVVKSVEPTKDETGKIIEGEYTIKFNIKGKSTTHSTTNPIYAVVVFDRSGSMIQNNAALGVVGTTKWANAKTGAIRFSELIGQSGTNKLALVTFSDKAKAVRETFSSDPFVDSNFEYPRGGTNLYKALMSAETIIDKAPANAKKVILVMSDGRPDDYIKLFTNGYLYNDENATLNDTDDLKRLKNKASIFTIGCSVERDKGAQHLLKAVASSQDYFSLAKPNNIVDILEKLANSISTQPAATGAKLTETLAPEFTLVDGETATKDLADIDENGQTITYKVKVKDKSMATGVYETNNKEQTKITVGNNTVLTINQSPSIYWERPQLKYNVKYHYQNLDKTGYDEGSTVSNVIGQYGETINKNTINPDTTTTYEQIGSQEGFSINNTKSESIKLTNDNSTINIYYDRNSYDYKVNYYYNNIKEDTKTFENQTYGKQITTYEEKTKDGYVFDRVENLPLTIGTGTNEINVYYRKRTDLKYRVEHYYDNQKDDTKTATFKDQTFGDKITTYQKEEKDGYRFCRVENLPLTITTNEDNNVIKAYYEKRTDLKYRVEYYYDNKLEETKTYENQRFEDVINIYEDKLKDGYKFDKVEGTPLTITTNEDNNVIKVYYVKRTDLTYKVNYYYDNQKESAKTYTNQIFGDEITTYEERTKDGYRFDKVENLPLTIGTGTNEINVYYVKRTDLKYRVEHYYDNQKDDTKTATFKDQKFEDVINNFTKEEKDGYRFCRVENLPLTITTNEDNNVIKAYYEKRTDLKYRVEYYYDNKLEETNTFENQKFEDVITTYVDKIKDGYRFDKVEGTPLTISTNENNNVIKVYYVKRTDLTYKVNYYYDKQKESTKTYTNQTFGDEITTYEERTKDGYRFDKVENLPLTIGTGTNEINVYYVKRTDLKYRVEYYYENKKDDSKTETYKNQTFEDVITTYVDKAKDGYRFDKVEGTPLTISTNEDNNVIKVYYVKRTDLKYRVEHYYDNKKDDTKTVTFKNQKFEDIINNFNKEEKDGYRFCRVENLPLTITTNEDNNVIKAYYEKRTDLTYRVEYYYDNKLEDTVKFENQTFEDVIKTYEDKVKVGYRFDKVEGTPLTISTNEDDNVIKVYYVKRTDLTYRVEYYYDNKLEDTVKFENQTFEDVVTAYEEKLKDGYKFDRVEGTPLTISADEEANVIKVYYIKVAKEEAIEIPNTGLTDITNTHTNKYEFIVIIYSLVVLYLVGIKRIYE